MKCSCTGFCVEILFTGDVWALRMYTAVEIIMYNFPLCQSDDSQVNQLGWISFTITGKERCTTPDNRGHITIILPNLQVHA